MSDWTPALQQLVTAYLEGGATGLLLGLPLSWSAWRQWNPLSSVDTWERTTARVKNWERSKGELYLRIAYSYSIGSRLYQGIDRAELHYESLLNSAMEKGEAITVYYNAKHPSRATLHMSPPQFPYWTAGLGGAFCFLGSLALACAAYVAWAANSG